MTRTVTKTRDTVSNFLKLSQRDKLQNILYSAGGVVAGQCIVTAVATLFFIGRYTLAGHVFSLKNVWAEWPLTIGLSQRMQWLHIGGPGGFGVWFTQHWDLIRSIYFHIVPTGLVSYMFIALILGLGATQKTNWFDHLLLKLRWTKIISSRLQEERTTPLQFLFLGPVMLLFSLPGVIVSSVAVFGGLALAHAYGYPSALNPVIAGLDNSVVQAVIIGFFGGHFYARKVTLKPGMDMQRYFLEIRAATEYRARRILEKLLRDEVTLDYAMDSITKMRSTHPSDIYPSTYRQLYEDITENNKPVPDHGTWMKWFMPFSLGIFIILILLGAYWKFYVPAHGGVLP